MKMKTPVEKTQELLDSAIAKLNKNTAALVNAEARVTAVRSRNRELTQTVVALERAVTALGGIPTAVTEAVDEVVETH